MSDRGHRAEKTAMKARHCDECKCFNHDHMDGEELCAKGHKPRHYMPRNAMDTDYGWKRVCVDFKPHNDLNSAGAEGAPLK